MIISMKNTRSRLSKKLILLACLAGVLIILFLIGVFLVTPEKNSTLEQYSQEVTNSAQSETKVKVSSFVDESVEQAVTYELSNGTTGAIVYGEESEAVTGFTSEIDVRVVDANFDGHDDFLLSYTTGAYNMETYIKLYDPVEDAFVDVDRKSDFLGAEPEGYITVDSDEENLSTLMRFRGIGDIYASQIFTYQSGRWSLAEVTVQDRYLTDAGNTVQGYYARTVSTYENVEKVSERHEYYRYLEATQTFQKIAEAEIDSV
jgi:hypothetical protein